jgi:uncharacterized protein
MKTKNIIILIVVIGLIAIVFSFFQGSKDQTAYINEINQERKEKDNFMRTSPESPFADSTVTFTELQYYPPNPKYKITATLTPIQNKKTIVLTTNDSKNERYIEYAYAEFDLDGFHHKLLILEMIDMGPFRGKLFLAFGDRTSAEDTYGAGRYLDVAKNPGSNTILLDFNKAYNPYCAYADKYSCPLPPSENLLSVPILAGEKNYHEE